MCTLLSRIARRDGSVAAIAALSLLVILSTSGAALDYIRAYDLQTRIDTALDSAVIAAAQKIKTMSTANLSEADAETIVRTAATKNIASNLISKRSYTLDVDVTHSGFTYEIQASYTSSVPTTFLAVLGIGEVAIAGGAAATTGTTPFMDVTLIVDTSGSMALGATKTDIDKLVSKFTCAFACHDNPGSDSYSWAEANGVKLRYDLIREAVLAFADFLDNHNEGGRTQVQLYTFSDKLVRLSSLNASTNQLRSNLPSAPVTSGETVGGTRWWEFAPSIAKVPAKSGDGSTRGKAMQLVLILTDGVQDPNRTWTSKTSLRSYVREFDWTVCDTLRTNGVAVGVVQVPYLPLDGDWGYNATLGQPSLIPRSGYKRIDDVDYALRKCGGALFLNASKPEDVVSSFEMLYKQAMPIRLIR